MINCSVKIVKKFKSNREPVDGKKVFLHSLSRECQGFYDNNTKALLHKSVMMGEWGRKKLSNTTCRHLWTTPYLQLQFYNAGNEECQSCQKTSGDDSVKRLDQEIDPETSLKFNFLNCFTLM